MSAFRQRFFCESGFTKVFGFIVHVRIYQGKTWHFTYVAAGLLITCAYNTTCVCTLLHTNQCVKSMHSQG